MTELISGQFCFDTQMENSKYSNETRKRLSGLGLKVLQVVDDNLGLIGLIQTETRKSKDEILRALSSLIKDGLVRRDEKSEWYEITKKGNEFLSKRGSL